MSNHTIRMTTNCLVAMKISYMLMKTSQVNKHMSRILAIHRGSEVYNVSSMANVILNLHNGLPYYVHIILCSLSCYNILITLISVYVDVCYVQCDGSCHNI